MNNLRNLEQKKQEKKYNNNIDNNKKFENLRKNMEKKKLIKKDFVNAIYDISNQLKLSKAVIKKVINLGIALIQSGLSNEYTIELRGLGTFYIKKIPEHKRSYKLKYDKTVKEKVIPEKYVVIFKPSSILLKEINSKISQLKNKQNEVKNSSKQGKPNLNDYTKEEVDKALNEILEDPEKTPISKDSDFYTNS